MSAESTDHPAQKLGTLTEISLQLPYYIFRMINVEYWVTSKLT